MNELSIIIVSYNEKEYIKDAIESCLFQKKADNFELIIGDDGSSDGSILLIEEYFRRFPGTIKYFVMDRDDTNEIIPSIRVSNIIKKAFDYAQGQYFMLMSADDLVLRKDRLYKQVDFLKQHPSVSSCYTDYKKFWSDGKEEEILSEVSLTKGVFWGIHYVHISCFVFKKEAAENFLPSFCDDTGALFSIIKTGKSKHLNMMGFAYRQRDKSIMHVADVMELSILELLLYQDILNSKGLYFSSLSRFSKPLKYVYRNRTLLANDKYEKYRKLSASKEHDILSDIRSADKKVSKRLYYEIKILISIILRTYFKLCRKIEKSFVIKKILR